MCYQSVILKTTSRLRCSRVPDSSVNGQLCLTRHAVNFKLLRGFLKRHEATHTPSAQHRPWTDTAPLIQTTEPHAGLNAEKRYDLIPSHRPSNSQPFYDDDRFRIGVKWRSGSDDDFLSRVGRFWKCVDGGRINVGGSQSGIWPKVTRIVQTSGGTLNIYWAKAVRSCPRYLFLRLWYIFKKIFIVN